MNVTNTEEWFSIISDIQHLSKLTIERQFFKTGFTLPDKWPKWQPQTNVHMLAAAAIAEEFVSQAKIKEDIGLHHIIKVTDYSSLNRLLAVTAYVCTQIYQQLAQIPI